MTATDTIRRQINSFKQGEKEILSDMGKEMLSFFEDTFKQKGFTDTSFVGWAAQKHNYGNPLLDKTGNLKSSLKLDIHNNEVIISSDVDYAEYVNDKRKFLGDSETLSKKLIELIDKDIVKQFNN